MDTIGSFSSSVVTNITTGYLVTNVTVQNLENTAVNPPVFWNYQLSFDHRRF